MAQDQAADFGCSERLLDYALASYQRQLDNFDKLDTKAATFAGFIGVILAISVGFLEPTASVPDQHLFSVLCLLLSRVSYSTAVLTLAVAFTFCLCTLKARPNVQPASVQDMIGHYRGLRPIRAREKQLVKDMTKTLAEAETNRDQNNHSKSKFLQRATTFLFVALALGMLGYLCQLLNSWTTI